MRKDKLAELLIRKTFLLSSSRFFCRQNDKMSYSYFLGDILSHLTCADKDNCRTALGIESDAQELKFHDFKSPKLAFRI